MKHVVTIHLLVETENEGGISEVEDAFTDSLMNELDGTSGTFCELVENPEYDSMAMEEKPTAEEEAEGYYEADGDQTEEEIEQDFTWEITDAQVWSIQDVPFGVGQRSVTGYLTEIEKRRNKN